MTQDFFKALENRRSIYGLAKESPVSDERIQEIVEFAVKYTPSAFNSQSSRVVVLLGDKHDRFWDLTEEQLRAVVPADNFSPTEEKIASFRNGYGTVLFFEDETVVKGLQEQFALYAENFPIWSEQTSGMHQLVVWTALEMEGLGASLQHYNPLVDEAIQKEWDIPSNWKLRGQMPFGTPTMPAGDKEFKPLEERVKIIK